MKKLVLLFAMLLTLFSAGAASSGIYLRGDYNSWGTSSDWEFQTTSTSNVYTLEKQGSALNTTSGFKIAGSDWNGDYNYGNGSTVAVGGTTELSYFGNNMTLSGTINSGSTYLFTLTITTAKSKATLKIEEEATAVTYSLTSTDAFSSKNASALSETSVSGLYSLDLGGIAATDGQKFTLSDGTNTIKASSATSCANSFVTGSTTATNDFQVGAGTYYKLFLKVNGTNDYSVCASTIPSTISFTPTATVSGGTVTLNANPTQITGVNPALISGYSIKRDGTSLPVVSYDSSTGAMTEYTNTGLSNGTYTYIITVTYKECVGGPDLTATGTVSAEVTDGVAVASSYLVHAWAHNNSSNTSTDASFAGSAFYTTSVTNLYVYAPSTAYQPSSSDYDFSGFLVHTSGWSTQWGLSSVGAMSTNTATVFGTSGKDAQISLDKPIYKYYFYNGSTVYGYVSTINNSNVTVVPTAELVAGTSSIKISAPVPTELANFTSYVKSYTVTRSDGTNTVTLDKANVTVSNGALTATDNTAVAGTTYTYSVVCKYIDCNLNGVDGPVLKTAAATTAEITPVASYITSTSSTPLAAVIGNCFKLVANVGGGEGTRNSTYLDKHYRITFPATTISWAENTPTGYTMSYTSLVIKNGTTVMRTLNGDDIAAEIAATKGTNPTLNIYGVYGATTATLTCTYTKTSDGSTFTSEDNIPIEYSNPATVNYITDITTLGRLYKVNGGTLVAEVHATDGGDVKSTAASYYDLKRYDGTAVSTTYSDYGATDLYQFSTAATMRPFKMNFVDQIVKNRGTSATITSAEAGSHYYLIVPHYSMVNLPILSSELSNFLNDADANGDRTLTLTASAAPALDLESAKVKAVSTPTIKGDALLGTYTTDVISYDLGATIIDQTNEKVVTFVSGTDVPTGVEGVTVANASIVGGEGMITISGATNSVIYDITGRTVASVNGDNTVYVPAGVYIVKAGTTTKKVAVK
jgi:hypothetical protein